MRFKYTDLTWFQKREHRPAAAGSSHLRMDAVPGESGAYLVHLRMTDSQSDQQLVVYSTEILQEKN